MRIHHIKWIPGNDLASRCKSAPNWHDVDRFHVSIYEGDTTDIKEIAKAVDDAERELGKQIWIVDEFSLTDYL